MNWTIFFGVTLTLFIMFDAMHFCYRLGREDKQNQEQERLKDETNHLRYQIEQLNELKNNIANNFPNLDLKTLTLPELLHLTSNKDYKNVYDEAYHDAYYNAFNEISKEYHDMQSVDVNKLITTLKEHDYHG